jgi:hypothetical protein
MPNILTFTPQHELDYKKNLQEFIELSSTLPPLNSKYDYESNHWTGVGNFTNFGVHSKNRDQANVFDVSLLPFAKAYVVYNNKSNSEIRSKFYALRAINAACVKEYGYVDITKLTKRDFTKGITLVKGAVGSGAAYQTSTGLKNLLEFLIEKKILQKFNFENSIRKPPENTTGDEADKNREKKMPDENALFALAQISSAKKQDLNQRDIFTTSTMIFLLSAPSRGSEPFYLRADCLHQEVMKANRAMELGLMKDDVELLLKEKSNISNSTYLKLDLNDEIPLKGVRWFSGKGFGYENKWLPTVMINSVTTAINRLKAQSSDARAFAKLLEDSSDFPRHKLCPDVSEDKLLTMDEAALALGLDLFSYDTNTKKRGGRNQLLKRKGIERKDHQVNLHDLNKIVRLGLPEEFPYIPFETGEGKVTLKWSDALYAGFANGLDSRRATIYTELSIPTIDTLNEDLAPTKKKNKATGNISTGTLSIFQRWGYGCMSMTSHQLRHMLDTMAAVNGMEGKLRAKWAQRSDPKHNRYYNHTTHEEYGADFIEDRENELATQEQAPIKQIQVQIATPRTIQELNTKASLTAHTTEFGMCLTSYLSESCTKYRDCINCNEHVCMKGDDGKCERIRQRLAREKKLLKQDEKAVTDGVQGAVQWYQRRKLTTERCEQLLDMMEDPNIEDGALIKISNIEEVTQLDRALEANGKKRLPEIVNFKRIQAVTVDTLITKKSNGSSETEGDFFDDIGDLDELNYMMEDG